MKRLQLLGAILSAFVVFAGASAQAKCEPERAKEKYPKAAASLVKVAATTTTLPFSYSDPADLTRLTGIEVEMVEAALQCAGLKYEFVKGPFSTLIQTVMSGSTDAMIGNVNYRPERAEKVDFVVYMRSGQSIIVRKGNPKGLRSLDDLCGVTASSTVGGVSAAEIEKQSAGCVARGKPAINYLAAVDQEAAVRQLVNGRIDFVMDGSISAKLRAESREGESLELGFTILTDLVIGVVIRKDNEEVRNAVLDGMKTLESDGRLKALVEKYRLSEFAVPVELRR